MNCLVFELSGDFGYYRNSKYNTLLGVNLTHQRPTNIQLAGLLGAIIGYDGYERWQSAGKDFPEFMEKLIQMEYAIVPEKVNFKTVVTTINNTTGQSYDKDRNGLTANIKFQYLICPKYTIYIKEKECESYKRLKEKLSDGVTTYQTLLGKRDLFAEINYLGEVQLEEDGFEGVVESWIPKEIVEKMNTSNLFSEEIMYYKEEQFNKELLKNNLKKTSYRTLLTNNKVQTKTMQYKGKNRIVFETI